ncbi:MAG: carbohydrate-binding family 9-like protein [Planctomycetia bacterium]|nr:carbohydrate-binding family 9-like protein [Planctomycetia bacterium]
MTNILDIIRLNTELVPGTSTAELWRNVPVFDQFALYWNRDEALPYTSVQLFHNDRQLAFRFVAHENDTVVLDSPLKDKMDVIQECRVEIFMQAEPDMARYYCLEMDPKGRVLDYQASYYRTFQRQWQCPKLQLLGRKTPDGYEVEGTLELDILRQLGILAADNTMRAGLYRAAFRHGTDGNVIQRWISWINPNTPEPDFHVPTSLGTLRLQN